MGTALTSTAPASAEVMAMVPTETAERASAEVTALTEDATKLAEGPTSVKPSGGWGPDLLVRPTRFVGLAGPFVHCVRGTTLSPSQRLATRD